jgi:hypothetical protein
MQPRPISSILVLCTTLHSAKAGDLPPRKPTPAPTPTPTSATPLGEVDYACLHQDSWLVNTDGHYNHILLSTTDITTSEYNSTSGKWVVEFPDVPNYDHNFTTSEVSALNSRPRAKSFDFTSGVSTDITLKLQFGKVDITSLLFDRSYLEIGDNCHCGEENSVGEGYRIQDHRPF